jgi:hypothetical protein
MKPLSDLPLFRYPAAPGFKTGDTSRDAARKVRADAATLREKVYRAFVAVGEIGLTADEAAKMVGRLPPSVRPRVTELTKENPPRVVPTKERRKNESTMTAIVWRVAR